MQTGRLLRVRDSEQVWKCLEWGLYSEVQVEKVWTCLWTDRQTNATEDITFATPLAGGNNPLQHSWMRQISLRVSKILKNNTGIIHG